MNTTKQNDLDTHLYIYNRRIRTSMRRMVDAGNALRAALAADSGPFKISLQEKQRRVERWDHAVEALRIERAAAEQKPADDHSPTRLGLGMPTLKDFAK